MQTIKFRGKRVDNGEWVYGCYLKKWTGENYKHYIHDEMFEYEVAKFTVGQYTGLSDKNKQEIYDEDICKITQGCGEVEMGEVAWDEQSLCWALDIGRELWHFSGIVDCGHLVEAIGNVWEDGSLLNDSQEQQTPEVTS